MLIQVAAELKPREKYFFKLSQDDTSLFHNSETLITFEYLNFKKNQGIMY